MKEEMSPEEKKIDNGWSSELNEWQREQFVGLSDEAQGVLKRYPALQTTFFGGKWTEVAGVDSGFEGLIDQLFSLIAEEEGGDEKASKIKEELIKHRKKKLKI